jgi:hypothetical protein
MNNKMVNGVVGGAVVEVDRRESESKGCDVFYPFGLAPPGVDTYVLWCVDRGRHSVLFTTLGTPRKDWECFSGTVMATEFLQLL